MAVYTQVAQDDLVSFLEDYNLGRLVSYEGIEQGVENSNFHLFTDKGRYILTLFEKRVEAADLPFFFSFTDHLAGRGIHCPQAIPGRDGGIIGRLGPAGAFVQNETVSLCKKT
jgi:homoserine kinase type II